MPKPPALTHVDVARRRAEGGLPLEIWRGAILLRRFPPSHSFRVVVNPETGERTLYIIDEASQSCVFEIDLVQGMECGYGLHRDDQAFLTREFDDAMEG
jgi:hypothetical protein